MTNDNNIICRVIEECKYTQFRLSYTNTNFSPFQEEIWRCFADVIEQSKSAQADHVGHTCSVLLVRQIKG